MADSRRSFLKKAGAGIVAATILPRNVFGAMGGNKKYVAPSDQLTRGIIGVGGIGMSGLHFASDDKCRLVAVCDVDQGHLNRALEAGFVTLSTTPTWTSSTLPPRPTGMASWPWRQPGPARTFSVRNP